MSWRASLRQIGSRRRQTDFASSIGRQGHSKEAVFLIRAASISGVTRSAESTSKPRLEIVKASRSLIEINLIAPPPLVSLHLHPRPWIGGPRIWQPDIALDSLRDNRLQARGPEWPNFVWIRERLTSDMQTLLPIVADSLRGPGRLRRRGDLRTNA